MNTIVNEDALTFKDIEETIFTYFCQQAVKTTQEVLKQLDVQLMNGRDKKKYRHKGLKDDHIRCVYGDVPYTRALYEVDDPEAPSRYVFLLNELLKMDNIGKVSMNVVEAIIGSPFCMHLYADGHAIDVIIFLKVHAGGEQVIDLIPVTGNDGVGGVVPQTGTFENPVFYDVIGIIIHQKIGLKDGEPRYAVFAWKALAVARHVEEGAEKQKKAGGKCQSVLKLVGKGFLSFY